MTGPIRPRRLRQSPALRRLVAETRLHPAELVLPVFVAEGIAEPRPISSMPGVVQHSLDSLRATVAEAARLGLGGVMLFGVPLPEHKDAVGSAGTDPDGILQRATRAAVAEAGDALVVQTDLCLDEFTDHGHCGVLATLANGDVVVDNDATLERYAEMGLVQAEAGSQLLGLSGMMDHQVAAVRAALDGAGHELTPILAYSGKYSGGWYGPFREAVGSSLTGDRRAYQLDTANGREGVREASLDIAEGADIVMVKPASHFLDVLAATAAASPVPTWAYQVSGEYSMIEAAAARGWVDRERMVPDSLLAIKRAGAAAILSYYALDVARGLRP
ncbi:MAG: porphobilinogen synthase [Microbacteriaceae bacterium]